MIEQGYGNALSALCGSGTSTSGSSGVRTSCRRSVHTSATTPVAGRCEPRVTDDAYRSTSGVSPRVGARQCRAPTNVGTWLELLQHPPDEPLELTRELLARRENLLMGQLLRAPGEAGRHVGDARKPEAGEPAGPPRDHLRTVDIPTASAPSLASMRTSAGVSNDGPSSAAYTPSSRAIRCERATSRATARSSGS